MTLLMESEAADIDWGFVQFDQDGLPLGSIGGLYESVLGTDPTGREMRPRKKVGQDGSR
jgi:hypothetical protein